MRSLMVCVRCFACVLVVIALTCNRGAATGPTPKENEERIIAAERTADLKVFEELLAEQAITVGPDGRRHNKSEMLDILRSIPPQNVTASDFVIVGAGRDATIVNYVVKTTLRDGSDREHTSTSVWVRQNSSWRMVFHQGTQIP